MLVSFLKKLVNLLSGRTVGACGSGGDGDVGSLRLNVVEGERVKGACWASTTTVSGQKLCSLRIDGRTFPGSSTTLIAVVLYSP